MRQLLLPGGVRLAWSSRAWLDVIFPSDSYKKELLKGLIRWRCLYPFERAFDEKIAFREKVLSLETVFSAMDMQLKNAEILAVFCNSRRSPPRIYVWFKQSNENFFLKLGECESAKLFDHEYEISRKIGELNDFVTPIPIRTVLSKDWAAILYEGIPLNKLTLREAVSATSLLTTVGRWHGKSGHSFNGIAHNDLGPHNSFIIDEELYIVDWETASESGPRYSNLVNLALLIDESKSISLPKISQIIQKHTGIEASGEEIRDCVDHLRAHGQVCALQRTVV